MKVQDYPLIPLGAYMAASLIAMAFMSITGVILIFSAVMIIRNERINTSALRAYKIIAAVFSLVMFASLAFNHWNPPIYASEPLVASFSALRKLWFLLIPPAFFVVFSALDARAQQKAFLAWWLTSIALGIFAIFQFFNGFPKYQKIPDVQFFHTVLFLGHHLSVASIWIFPTFAALGVALARGVGDSRNKKIIWASSFFGLLTLFLAFSRAGWLVSAFSVVLLILLSMPWLWSLLTSVALGIGFASAYQIPLIHNRLNWNSGITERYELWKMALTFFHDHPWLGVGWLQVQRASEFYFKQIDPTGYKQHFWGHAHDIYLEMLGGSGILGFTAWLALACFPIYYFIRVMKDADRSRFEKGLARGFFVAWIALLLNGITQVNFWEAKVAHQTMIAIAISILLYAKKIRVQLLVGFMIISFASPSYALSPCSTDPSSNVISNAKPTDQDIPDPTQPLKKPPPPILMGCQRPFTKNGITYSTDSPKAQDAQNLKEAVADVPKAKDYLDTYQSNINISKISAYTGTSGLLLYLLSGLITSRVNPNYRSEAQTAVSLGGLVLAAGGFAYSFTLMRTNELFIPKAVDAYNAARPNEPVELKFEAGIHF